MLTDRITTIFQILSCTHSDIADCAGCSASYIRLIHANKRGYSPKDKPMTLLAGGIYSYADKENRLDVLAQLCHADGNSRELLIPSMVAWLFDTDEKSIPEINVIPIKKKREMKNRSFGEKLNAVMELLELSNARLARSVNVDDSYISRFRSGVRAPSRDSEIARLLAETLYKRVMEQSLTTELSRLSQLPHKLLCDIENGEAYFSAWLYNHESKRSTSEIDRLLACIDSFSPQSRIPLPETSSFLTDEILNSDKTLYWGMEGLQEAVLRFLGETAQHGGALWLYSDESIDWMVGDPDYFSKWYALMLACVRRGVRIKIIHNLNRSTSEMISAIESWMPLYMSGMIEAFVCRRGHDTRFSHTIFLRPDAAGISASHVRGTEANSCYHYLTDECLLSLTKTEFECLYAQADPLIQIHIGDGSRLFFSQETEEKMYAMLPVLSLGTLSEKLLGEILDSRQIDKNERQQITAFCAQQRLLFTSALKHGGAYEFVHLPDDKALFDGKVRINLAPSLCEKELFYTPEEFAAHVSAAADYLARNIAYRFYEIPELPFSDIQIISGSSKVIVIKSSPPRAAFVFTEPVIIHAFQEYFEMLMRRYESDRSRVRQSLKRFL